MNSTFLPCPQKRQFVPSFDSILGNGKRFRTTQSSYRIQPCIWNITDNSVGARNLMPESTPEEVLQRPPLRAKRFLKPNAPHHFAAVPDNKQFLQPRQSQSFTTMTGKLQQFNYSIADRSKPRQKPFIPQHPAYPEVKPARAPVQPFILHSSLRAEQRAQFDEQRRERERRAALAQEAQRLADAEREQAEIQEMRKRMQFRARPLQLRDPFVPLLAQRPLTIPQGPELLTTQRGELREAMKQLNNLSLMSDSSTTATLHYN